MEKNELNLICDNPKINSFCYKCPLVLIRVKSKPVYTAMKNFSLMEHTDIKNTSGKFPHTLLTLP